MTLDSSASRLDSASYGSLLPDTPTTQAGSSSSDSSNTAGIGSSETSRASTLAPEGDPLLANGRESWNYPKSNTFKTVSMFVGMMVFGMNDSSLGVLIKSLEKYYQITYLVVSYTFLFGFLGYLIAAFVCDVLHRFIGRWGVVTLGGFLQFVCFSIAYFKPPFQLFIFGYFLSGFGNGLLEASWNAWAGNLNSNNEILGLLHGSYGLGGIISPAVATTLLLNGYSWNLVYLVLAVITGASTVLSFMAFNTETASVYKERMKKGEQDRALKISQADETTKLLDSNNEHHHQAGDLLLEIDPALALENLERTVVNGGRLATFKEAVSSELVWVISFALFVYCGEEIGMGGWIPTFMIDERHGNEKTMGYVGTAYWVGMTVGRMGLGFVNGRLNMKSEHLALIYTVVSLVCILVFWLVPSVAVSSICSPLIGFFTATLYPTAMVVFLDKFPEHLHVVGIGFLAASGGIGGALVPFLIGVLTTKYGAWTLGPVSFLCILFMLFAWIFVLKRY